MQSLGGVVSRSGKLLPTPMPGWAKRLLARIEDDVKGFHAKPNHILVNWYSTAHSGILPHEDGPVYEPLVAILSLAAPAVLRFAKKRSMDDTQAAPDQQEDEQQAAAVGEQQAAVPREARPHSHDLIASVVCQPRSLLVFSGHAYTSCLHGILDQPVDHIDAATTVNAEQAGLQLGQKLERASDRISLTVRRVLQQHSLAIRL